MAEYRFIRPLDVLFLRGNRLFGGPGDFGESMMPPKPSIIAGALRSKMLGLDPAELAAFVANSQPADERLRRSLGLFVTSKESPDGKFQEGEFRISLFTIARKSGMDFDWFMPLSADLTATEGNDKKTRLDYLQPNILPTAIASSTKLPLLPVLRAEKQQKPISGCWQNSKGIKAYLNGENLNENHVIRYSSLWKKEQRLGIALDRHARSAAEGQIYTTDAISVVEDVGFIVGVDGADGLLPSDGLLRLGGDGRSAEIATLDFRPFQPSWDTIKQSGRFRLILTAPGLFTKGWLPNGVVEQNGSYRLQGSGFSARLVAAAVPRAEVISGWDLAHWCPKPAERVVPTGSVYWFDEVQGDLDALGKLAKSGWWAVSGDNAAIDRSRRAEGFNNVMVAAWPQGEN